MSLEVATAQGGNFDPSALSGSDFDPGFNVQQAGAVLVFNLSPIDIVIKPPDSQPFISVANTVRCKHYKGGYPGRWGWAQITPLPNITNPYSSVVRIEALYAGTDEIPPESIVPLTRQANVGNQVSVSTASALKQDGLGPGTSFIESTPSDQASSAFNLFNDASGTIKILSAGNQRIIYSGTRGNATTGHAVVQFGDSAEPLMSTIYAAVGAGSTVLAASVQPGTFPAGIYSFAQPSQVGIHGTGANGDALNLYNDSDALKTATFGYAIASEGLGRGLWAFDHSNDASGVIFSQGTPSAITFNNVVNAQVGQFQASNTNTRSLFVSATNAQGFRVAAIQGSTNTATDNCDLLDLSRSVTHGATFTVGINPSTQVYLYDVNAGAFVFIGDGTTGGTFTIRNKLSVDNGNLTSDGNGRLTVGQPDILRTGHQEVGRCGFKTTYFVPGGVNLFGRMGSGANFKTDMQNVPSSMTLGVDASGTVNDGPYATDISVDGFFFEFGINVNGAAGFTSYWYGHYTTVGNCIKAVRTDTQTFDQHCDSCGVVHASVPFADLMLTAEPEKDAPGHYGMSYRCPDCGAVETYNTRLSAADEQRDDPVDAENCRNIRALQAALGLPMAD